MPKLMSKGLSPIVAFERGARIPIHEQIADGLRQAISGGRIREGTRLASTRVLAEDWDVSRNTVLHIFETLISEGYVISNVGDGTYVTDIARAQSELSGKASGEKANKASGYPFRGLSRRGRNAVSAITPYRFEKPVPFAPNVPDLNDFPIKSWLRLMNEVSGGLTGASLAASTDSGFLPLRQAIAHRLGVDRGVECDPEQIVITSGTQQGLDLVIRLLTDRGDPVWIENPNYGGTLAAVSANGVNAQFMNVDQDGARFDNALQDNLAPRLICLSPARQFPTGANLCPKRGQQFLDFAASSGAWILEDDFDAEFQYVAPRSVPLFARDLSNRVILMATFSTTLVPSLRMGYLVIPRDLIRSFQMARAVAHGHVALLEQMVIAEMMNRGIYAAHLRRMRKLYHTRQQALAHALDSVLAYSVPQAELRSGMHLVLPLVAGYNDVRLAQELAQRGLIVQPLSPLYRTQEKRPGLLLGFAPYDEQELISSVRELEFLKPVLDRSQQDWRRIDRVA